MEDAIAEDQIELSPWRQTLGREEVDLLEITVIA